MPHVEPPLSPAQVPGDRCRRHSKLARHVLGGIVLDVHRQDFGLPLGTPGPECSDENGVVHNLLSKRTYRPLCSATAGEVGGCVGHATFTKRMIGTSASDEFRSIHFR
jgi:hypothetical protein